MSTPIRSYDQAKNVVQKWVDSIEETAIESAAFPNAKVSSRDILAHGHNVATTLREWGADVDLQIVGLVHSLLWNCVILPNQVSKAFGEQTALLCRESQRILEKAPETRWRGQPYALERVKYYILAYRHLDLALLSASELWNQYQLSREGDDAHRQRFTDFARQVIRPYLQFLGMSELDQKLESEIAPSAKRHHSESLFATITEQVRTQLPNASLSCRPYIEPLTIGSENSFSLELSGAIADESKPRLRPLGIEPALTISLVMDSEERCYQALYHLHQLFKPVEGTVHDFIAGSLSNGYSALQTTVLREGVQICFEICTHQMDEVNRWGLAAAQRAMESQNGQPELGLSDDSIMDAASIDSNTTGIAHSGSRPNNAWWHNAEYQFGLIESAPMGSLNEMLYVFGSRGELFGFYRGCTVVDYTYNVEGELATQTRRFFINGDVVEPAAALHHLDLVEIEHDPTALGPTRVWLNAAHTPLAKTQISRYLKRHGEGIHHAQKILDEQLKALENHYGFSMPEYRVNQALSREVKRRHVSSKEGLMAEISSGRLNANRILHPLFADEIVRQVQIPADLRLRPHQLTLAECCRPKQGDDIVGIPTIRNGVASNLQIHGHDCLEAKQLASEKVSLKWRLQPTLRSIAQIELRALDETGLLGDAINQIYAAIPQVTLHRSASSTRNGVATARFVIEAAGAEVIDAITENLRQLPNRTIDEVYHTNLPLSEQEELIQPLSATQANPYSRMPVYEEGMFFGRSRELSEIRDWLRTRIGVIWLIGQKRVGKTSLLLHLKNHFLDSIEFTPIYLDFQMLSSLQAPDIFFEIASSVFSELQSDGQGAELGPPLRTMFDYDPMGHLIRYLKSAQSHPSVGKLVLLLDEFSRTTDAYRQGKLEEAFFVQWRGLVQMTQPDIKYVVVVQQQAFDGINRHSDRSHEDPSWRLMELGERRTLQPLTNKDARNLIEWPIRNYLESTPELLDRIHALTGSSPFLIQSFCFKLVSHMMQLNKRQLGWNDLDIVRMEFMSPNESVFAHLLDLLQGVTNSMCIVVAKIADEELQRNSRATPLVSWEQIAASHPVFLSNRLRGTLEELCDRHILVSVKKNDGESWRFSSLLFQEWLALNSGE